MASTKAQAQKWSATASSYVRYFEPSSLALGRNMLNCMKLQYQDIPLRVIEAGAGAGGLAKELCGLPATNFQEVKITDVSEGMLEQAREKLAKIAEDNNLTVENADFTKFPYEDGSFDRYYANMCLHYAENPENVIREASRILGPGGIAGFTIWGRSKDSPIMTIVPDVLDDLGLHKKDPCKRSNFHLDEDDDGLRQRFFSNGFERCSVVHIPAAIECFDASSFVEIIIDGAASTKKQVESFPKEDQKKVRDRVHDCAKVLLDKGHPMALDVAIILARKATA